MTTPTPTPEKQNSPDAPGSEQTETTGFFHRVRQNLKSKKELVHPSEEAEIVIMEEPDNQ
jgi:hypothetical protein